MRSNRLKLLRSTTPQKPSKIAHQSCILKHLIFSIESEPMLTWNTHQTPNRTTHAALMNDSGEQQVRHAIESCADKAIHLLKNNIQDDSLYLLFEWDLLTTSLNIVVTDSSKTQDAPEVVHCIFSGVHNTLVQADKTQQIIYADTVKFWLHDYLTTCTAFFSYSLVAIFHSGTRQNTELL